MSGSITGFLRSQVLLRLPEPTGSYAGKTIIVTGSNVGLGKEAARHFARLGASTVILAVRSLDKGNAAKADIENSLGVSNIIKVWKLDMASYRSVLDFATKVENQLSRVDVALLNAGVARGKYEIFEDHEATITVNVVSTFLLALSLLPKLEASAEQFQIRPNLTIVASGVHFFAKFEERKAPEGGIFERLKQELNPSEMEERYQVSKLLDILCTRALCERKPTSQTRVTINCVCPGLCKS
ncbi:Short-chain dehydrogenase/reductase SDR [Macrophomina phaseolina MS6]|uniref:Short-chain dehydrogenase/reductase SDR n=1 Tax=Macrophomina phaseolina (strain MS6) TaxID=1126212 RepID=K2SSS2_MACPH|nr:Short-chain dehydrogenase/reductase SDR [Macrophomina phaseolina MS6]